MSRIRRFNRKVLGYETDLMTEFDSLGGADGIIIPEGPIDIIEQEELIEKFEVNLLVKNRWYINAVSLAYIICAGVYLMLLTKRTKMSSIPLILGFNSIILSFLALRYHLVNDYVLLRSLKLKLTNRTIDILNITQLIMIEWIVIDDYRSDTLILVFLHLPVLLFLVQALIKLLLSEIDSDLSQLRDLKYNYKNA